MAAPPEKTIKNLSGKYNMNKELSDSTNATLALQGLGFLLRKAVDVASVVIEVNQYEAPPKPPSTSTDVVTHIDIAQTAAGLSTTHENRCLDDVYREHSDWLFGDVRGKSRFVKLSEIEDEFLKTGWEDPEATYFLSEAENPSKGWQAWQIWGFQQVNGERRYCRNAIVTKKDKKETLRLVYDYVG